MRRRGWERREGRGRERRREEGERGRGGRRDEGGEEGDCFEGEKREEVKMGGEWRGEGGNPKGRLSHEVQRVFNFPGRGETSGEIEPRGAKGFYFSGEGGET